MTPSPLPSRLRRTISIVTLASTCLAPVALHAQPPVPPRGWVSRLDPGASHDGDGGTVSMADMKPGFHVTTGPAAILFDSTMRASGDWRLEATIHLFDPGARAEGFGVFFGGRDLNTSTPHYSYALVRRDGKALLKVRDGAAMRTVRDWTANGAIPVWRGGPGVSSVKYPLVIEARGPRVTMWVGATQVLDAPRTDLPTDGVVGVRVNHSLNLHVESVAVRPLAGPPRR